MCYLLIHSLRSQWEPFNVPIYVHVLFYSIAALTIHQCTIYYLNYYKHTILYSTIINESFTNFTTIWLTLLLVATATQWRETIRIVNLSESHLSTMCNFFYYFTYQDEDKGGKVQTKDGWWIETKKRRRLSSELIWCV